MTSWRQRVWPPARHRAFTDRRRSELHSGSSVVDTDVGPIEYVVRGGDVGPVVLFFHGAPGGYDQAMLTSPVPGGGERVVGWSRPGYLRTPIEVGATFAEQADAAAALLDALDIEVVVAFGISAGGPPATEFARRHPDRIAGLILESAVSRRYAPEVPRLASAVYLSGPGTWLSSVAARRLPGFVIGDLLREESTFDRASRRELARWIAEDDDRRRMAFGIMESLTPYEDRRTGLENDLRQLAAVDDTRTDGVRCPTLVLHGTHDGDVDPSHARHAASTIAGAALVVVDEGWHLLDLSKRHEEAARAKRRFVDGLTPT